MEKVKAPPAQGVGMKKYILVFDYPPPDDKSGSKSVIVLTNRIPDTSRSVKPECLPV
jgi:hypothetical protein